MCVEEATATATALRQRCNVTSSWAMGVCRRLQPLGTRPRHTKHCGVLEFAHSPFLIYVGLKIRVLRLMPEAERLAAPGLPSVMRVWGVCSFCTNENKAASDIQHPTFLTSVQLLGCFARRSNVEISR
jgi:hypothetical protein